MHASCEDAQSKKKIIPLILTLNPIKKILNNNFTLLQFKHEARDIFKFKLRVLGTFRRDTNLKDSLVHSSKYGA